ncbi:uncharacterized protein METZ01_LOCUS11607 [marine metagenome]|uniref:Uncharacterized protein n=1 Tax=marine metagenome TaxID=408172 RepID=A0A381NZ93_9ZZZZ
MTHVLIVEDNTGNGAVVLQRANEETPDIIF